MVEHTLDFASWVRARKAEEASEWDDEFGEAFFQALDAEADVEKNGWAVELADRVATRVQANDRKELRKRAIVYWSKHRTAFAFPGRNIYLSRRLLEEALPEDAVAFVFAHELAHHRLGHVQQLFPALKCTRLNSGVRLAAFAAQAAVRVFRSPEQEGEADAWALSRCQSVGYDGRACLRLFDLLRNIALDYRDADMANGRGDPERLAARELTRDRQPAWRKVLEDVGERIELARWEIVRGYPSIRDRRARLEALLSKVED
jgi:Zn-dependent protease with chaperone function